MPSIGMGRLTEFARELLAKKGVPAAAARRVADVVVQTEAFGVTTHGLAFLTYADGAIPSIVDPAATPRVVRRKGAGILVDARRGFSQLALDLAVDLALRASRRSGVAMVGVRNAGWLGAVGVHLLPVVRAGFLAQLWAQTNTCKDCAPIGGLDATFSTNPVALAFPTGGDPVIADFSSAAVSMGKVNRMIRRGERAPERIFQDRDGRLTDDPGVVPQGGSILFLGGEHYGHKGFGLSLWCESLVAVAGGSCNNPGLPTSQSFTLIVVDPDAFAGREAYMTEMKRFVSHVKASRRRPGVPAIRLPGERGLAALREAERSGVPVEDAMLVRLNELAAKHGMAPMS